MRPRVMKVVGALTLTGVLLGGERRRRTPQRRLLRRRQVRPLLPVRRLPRTPARTCRAGAINLGRA